MLTLRDRCGATVFIEGGTYHGDTACWAAEHFATIHTIEADPNLHLRFTRDAPFPHNITAHLGSTTDVLPHIVSGLDGPAIFWLDSHWSAGDTYGAANECPLIEEIGIIYRSPIDHVIFIDDASFFFRPPPLPHNPRHWPPLRRVFDALCEGGRHPYIIIQHDAIICVPNSLEPVVYDWSRSAPDAPPESAGSIFRRIIRWPRA